MKRASWVGCVLAAALVGLATPAAAAPDESSDGCTLAQVRTTAQGCRACRTFDGDRLHCARLLAPTGLARACRRSGITAWTEIWCQPPLALPAVHMGAPAPAKATAAPPPLTRRPPPPRRQPRVAAKVIAGISVAALLFAFALAGPVIARGLRAEGRRGA